ncbi:hypothetical protein KSP39_PZI017484 [Platanthera zijinensis]|uniref:Uncharacterized protein n=1 Tax=Platanthera zijinensis TaxID=2320716 RepID=A0AAP0G015_9ASPA
MTCGLTACAITTCCLRGFPLLVFSVSIGYITKSCLAMYVLPCKSGFSKEMSSSQDFDWQNILIDENCFEQGDDVESSIDSSYMEEGSTSVSWKRRTTSGTRTPCQGLTGENVASHLQKYRIYRNRMRYSSSAIGAAAMPAVDAATEQLFSRNHIPRPFLSTMPGQQPYMQIIAPPYPQHQWQMEATPAASQQQQYYHQSKIRHFMSPLDLTQANGGFLPLEQCSHKMLLHCQISMEMICSLSLEEEEKGGF